MNAIGLSQKNVCEIMADESAAGLERRTGSVTRDTNGFAQSSVAAIAPADLMKLLAKSPSP